MGDRVWDRPIVRILLVVLGFAGILLGFFLWPSPPSRMVPPASVVVTSAIALALMIGGVLLIRSAVS
jgi:hypothetical protein